MPSRLTDEMSFSVEGGGVEESAGAVEAGDRYRVGSDRCSCLSREPDPNECVGGDLAPEKTGQ